MYYNFNTVFSPEFLAAVPLNECNDRLMPFWMWTFIFVDPA